MFDLVKLNIKDRVGFENQILSSNVVDLRTSIDTSTGEVREFPKIGKYFNLDIRINPTNAFIRGSLHKLENLCFFGVEQNHNDFTYENLEDLIPLLLETFEIKGKTSLSNLELGFNLKVDCDPQKLIDNNILMHNLKSPSKDLKFRGRGDYKEFIRTDYSLKIYNKSKQYKLDDNILRIEIKITSKRKLQKLGIFMLEDLLDKNLLYNVFELLWEEFDKTIIIDNHLLLDIPENDIQKLNLFTNPNYWQFLNETGASYKVRKKRTEEFINIIQKHGLDKPKIYLQYKLIRKFFELINLNMTDLFYPKEAA